MGLFGGVQIVSIICSLIRTKLLAIWVGPIGVGLFLIYNSALDTIYSISSISIGKSSVRYIASASPTRRKIIIAIVRRWALWLGMLGAIITLVLSPFLSRWTFGDDNHSWCFMVLSVVMLFNAFSDCEKSVMQGTSRLSALAKSSVVGVILGVAVSVPLFYYLRIESVVPSIIAFTLVTAVATWWYSRKQKEINTTKPKLNMRETLAGGKEFVKLGIFMTLSAFATYLFSYLLVIYLNHTANTEVVGLYQAGNTLVDKYAGLLFTAMAMEYYPRLAKASASPNRLRIFVTQQIKLTLCVLLPIIVLFMTFREVIVQLLYSQAFYAIIPFITYGMIGTIFRAISWSLAFVILAKGSGKLYLTTEVTSAVVNFALSVWFYNIWGFTGIGIAIATGYIVYTIIVVICYHGYYKLQLHKSVWLIALIVTILSVIELVVVMNNYFWISLLISVFCVAIGLYMLGNVLKIRKKAS